MNVLTQKPLLVSNPTNIRYLTGFVSAAPHAREAFLVVTPEELAFFTNPLYTQQAKKLVDVQPVELAWHDLPIRIIEYNPEQPFPQAFTAYLTEVSITEIGFEDRNLTVSELTKLKETAVGITFVPVSGTIEDLRKVKRDDELDHIRRAAQITDECFSYITRQVKGGITERELAWSIESFIRTRGAQLAFDPIVAYGSHASMPHYQMTEQTRLEKNTPILFDFGARVNGYCADMTRMVVYGLPSDEFARAYGAVLEGQKKSLQYLESNPSPSGAKADEAARNVLKDFGLPMYPHSIGHAVGLDIHESPRLTVHHDETLMPNMVVTVEPAVYLEGQFGIRIEDLIRLTDSGIELLSKTPKELLTIPL